MRDALDSLLAQTYPDFELVICDNASSDQTEDICRTYAARDTRIRYYRNPQNLGAAPNYNKAFALARGQYFKWAAHDDLCAPEYLEQCVRVLDRNAEVVLCHSQTLFIDAQGQPLAFDAARNRFFDPSGIGFRQPESPQHLRSSHPAARYEDILFKIRWCFEVFGLIRAEALQQTSRIGPYYGSDKVLLAELSLMGGFVQIASPCFFRRCHREQSGFSQSKSGAWITRKSARYPHLLGFGNVAVPRLRCMNGYVRAIFKAPLSAHERNRCLLVFVRWLFQLDNWRRLTAEVHRQVLKGLPRKMLKVKPWK